MNIKFYPAVSIPIKVCNALYDAKAIFVQDSDKPGDERWLMELYAFRSNVQLTDHLNAYITPITDFASTEATGRVQYNLYHGTDRWINPLTGTNEEIPDYYVTAWTSAGAAVFDVTAGTAKVTHYPNHGQDMFAVSSGRYGWDLINGIPGTNQGKELYDFILAERTYFMSNLGRYPSTFSFRNGEDACYKMMMKYFLAGRNSYLLQADLAHNSKTNYGLSKDTGNYLGNPAGVTTRQDRISSNSSTRYKDMTEHNSAIPGTWGTDAQIRTYIAAQLRALINAGGGFYNDFIHRYQYFEAGGDKTAFNSYMTFINTTIGSDLVWRTSYANAMEYLFYREMIVNPVAFQHGNLVRITFEKIDPYKNNINSGISEKLSYDLLRVSISIRIDLTGTYLAGKSITTNYGSIKSNGANVYIIQIPYGNVQEGFGGCELSETTTPAYISLDLPTITASSKSGTTVTVTTNVNTRAALFKVAGGGAEIDMVIHGRSNTLKTTHTFDITGFTTYDFKCGVITEHKQSILSNTI